MSDDRPQDASRTSAVPARHSQSNTLPADEHRQHADYCVDMLSCLTGTCVDPSD